jgi:hypothetical protein
MERDLVQVANSSHQILTDSMNFYSGGLCIPAFPLPLLGVVRHPEGRSGC